MADAVHDDVDRLIGAIGHHRGAKGGLAHRQRSRIAELEIKQMDSKWFPSAPYGDRATFESVEAAKPRTPPAPI
jgi:hypothetical protein